MIIEIREKEGDEMATPVFKYKRHLLQANYPQIVEIYVGTSQTILSGDLIIVTGGYAIKATDGSVSAGKLLGIAQESVTSTTEGVLTVKVMLVDQWTVITAPVTGTGIAQASLFTLHYDIDSTAQIVDETDTTGGFLTPIILPDAIASGYCDFVPKASVLWNA